ncbi:unnamed protein product, partial [Amoebophrya sp. A25]|eukprot:GSA25T00017076001.1
MPETPVAYRVGARSKSDQVSTTRDRSRSPHRQQDIAVADQQDIAVADKDYDSRTPTSSSRTFFFCSCPSGRCWRLTATKDGRCGDCDRGGHQAISSSSASSSSPSSSRKSASSSCSGCKLYPYFEKQWCSHTVDVPGHGRNTRKGRDRCYVHGYSYNRGGHWSMSNQASYRRPCDIAADLTISHLMEKEKQVEIKEDPSTMTTEGDISSLLESINAKSPKRI